MYISTDGCINKWLTYLLTYLLTEVACRYTWCNSVFCQTFPTLSGTVHFILGRCVTSSRCLPPRQQRPMPIRRYKAWLLQQTSVRFNRAESRPPQRAQNILLRVHGPIGSTGGKYHHRFAAGVALASGQTSDCLQAGNSHFKANKLGPPAYLAYLATFYTYEYQLPGLHVYHFLHQPSASTSFVWNQLSVNTRTANTLGSFKLRLKTVYFSLPPGRFGAITALLIHPCDVWRWRCSFRLG